MSKRTQNQKRLREEEQAIGAIYKQYIDTFQETGNIPTKTFVKSSTLYAETGKEDSNKGQLYTPRPTIKLKTKCQHQPQTTHHQFAIKKPSKPKSNLKSLGDELKMLQQERTSRDARLVGALPPTSPEADYVTSTNLFISNLNPHFSENDLIQIFGTYGPLASVKIMWPRGGDGPRGANCGFVAFMSRGDAERALSTLGNRGDMRVNWGKPVKIPQHPVYVPEALHRKLAPPPPSGLPFNAQRVNERDWLLEDAIVKVTIPLDRSQLLLIHRMIEFVIRHGPQFESIMIAKEQGNPIFDFLWEFQSPEHTYYRWKLFSMLNGDPKNAWSMKPFRMFQGGSIWIPPTAPNYRDGMPQELVADIGTKLTDLEFKEFSEIIKNLNLSRKSIANAMCYCLLHSSAINDSVEIITNSLLNRSTNKIKKITRLYLLSDIIYNCNAKSITLKRFNDGNHSEICLALYKSLHSTYTNLEDGKDKDNFQLRVLMVLRSWNFFSYFNIAFITQLETIFLYGDNQDDNDDSSSSDSLDEPFDGATLMKHATISRPKLNNYNNNNNNRKKFDMFDPHF